jgi:excisionase family DNA binding protein
LTINGTQYYRTAEACKLAGISKITYLRWVREGQISDVVYRDRRGWRLFTEDDLSRLMAETGRVDEVSK